MSQNIPPIETSKQTNEHKTKIGLKKLYFTTFSQTFAFTNF